MNRFNRLLSILMLICLPIQGMAGVFCGGCFSDSDQEQHSCHSAMQDKAVSNATDGDANDRCNGACCVVLFSLYQPDGDRATLLSASTYQPFSVTVPALTIPPLLKPPLVI